MLEKLLISSVMNKHFRAEINFFFQTAVRDLTLIESPLGDFFVGKKKFFTLDIDKLSE